ncbi:MAG TPA: urease accessory UreF family protein [Gemmataceae bacterium]|nr:urease accessory UreF family protein [Gemmataceae bacterium]
MNLRLLQIADSALPIGGYSHSWGLEAAIDRGIVRDAANLEEWTRSYLRESLAPLEGVVIGNVVRDPSCTIDANRLLWASVTPPTLRHASRDMGGQLASLAARWEWAAEAIRRIEQAPGVTWHHAVVFALLASAAGATASEAVTLFLHQAAIGVISAGVRGVPIGHTHGQQVLARLHNDIAELAANYYDKPLETAGSNSPAHEILCYEQSRLYTRIYRS